jgi:Domain of unknown function (DUF4845)
LTPETARLPLWRIIAAVLVLAGMAGVLLALAPVYFEDFQLRQYIRSLVRDPKTAGTPEETLRSALLERARQLDLPIEPGDIRISHPDGKLQLQIKYEVQMDFPLYQVDLHFHPDATSP